MEFLEFTERQTLNETRGKPERYAHEVKPKMFAISENINRCPVEVYKAYATIWPADYCYEDDPFYIATSTQ